MKTCLKKCAMALGIVAVALSAPSPAEAQLGSLIKGAQTVKKVSDIKVTEAEELQIGKQVSDKMVEAFGVFQDAGVNKYVTLVGAVLAQASPRPQLPWQFVILDTEGVNAFAAPGGYVHITKGLLGMLKTEAELAGVLSHEIIHVTEKHTVNAIQKSEGVKATTEEVGGAGLAQSLVARIAQRAYSDILNNRFSRDDEVEADDKGVQLANKLGYAPSGLVSALNKLADRNKDAKEPNGLFASHPLMKERIANIEKTIKEKKLTATATVQSRYAKNITFEAKPTSAIATVAEGSRGLAGSGGDKKPADDKKAADSKDAKKEEEPKKSGGMLSKFKPSSGSQAQQSQTVASAGARGVVPDRDAVGGSNKNRVTVKIGPSDIAEFQKGIVA
jgi:predicted Zn-dependent protease